MADFYAGEVDGKATIRVALSHPAGKEVLLVCSTLPGGSAKEGEDYEPKTESLLFAVGETVKSFEVAILTVPSDPIESEETVLLGLSGLVEAVPGEFMAATLRIIDGTTPPKVNLRVNTNMDAIIDKADDDAKRHKKAMIVNVNNVAEKEGALPFNQDNKMNGGKAEDELRTLKLSRITNFPPKGSLTLEVYDDTGTKDGEEGAGDKLDNLKMRIFNEKGEGVIGPPAAFGGPDKSSYVVPPEAIQASDLNYWIECCDHGNQKIKLTLKDDKGAVVDSDWVRVVLNVDRLPLSRIQQDPEKDPDDQARFYVQLDYDTNDVDGIAGKISTPKAKMNYAPSIRKDAGTGSWMSVADVHDPADRFWLQTGITCWRHVGDPDLFYAI